MAFSPDNNHISVNYHYVEDPRLDAGGIHPCSIEEFERQIAFLSRDFRFVSVPEVLEASRKGLQEKLCAITFDDGLVDQLEYAVPVLNKYRATATFFIITGTLEGRMPSAHMIHLISSRVPMSALIEKFNAFLSRVFPPLIETHRIPSDHYLDDKRRHDDMLSANFKEMLNNIASREVTHAFLVEMLKELAIHEQDACRNLFMNEEQIRVLAASGFLIGTHTHNHYSLDREPSDVLREDFRMAADTLKRITGASLHVMAYPYGRAPRDRSMLAECGITHGVTVESRSIARDDDMFAIPRFDTNDVRSFLIAHG